MNKRQLTLYFVTFLLAIGLLVMPAQQAIAHEEDVVITGDEVKIETSTGSIKCYPHTLTASGWITVEFQSIYTGQVDVVLGFNGYDGAGLTKTDLNKDIGITWDSTLGASKWQDVEVAQDVKAGQWYKVMCWVDVPFTYTEEGEDPQDTKYNILIKPSKLTLADAIKSGSYLLLDPWYSSSWDYRISYTISRPSGAVTDYQWPIKVYYGSGTNGTESYDGLTIGKVYVDGNCQADFDDIRVTSEDGQTLQDIWLEKKVDSSYAVYWVEHDSVGTTATTFYVYYGNAGASSVSDIDATFSAELGDDFERGNDGDAPGNGWAQTSGNVEIDTGRDIGDETGFQGTRSLLIEDDGVDNGQTIQTCAHSENHAVRMRLYKEDATKHVVILGYNTVGNTQIYFRIGNDEEIDYYDGTFHGTGVYLTPDDWNLMEIRDIDYTAETYAVYVNGSTASGCAMNSGSANDDEISINQPEAGLSGSVDNFVIRNYRSTELTFGSWGSEETGEPVVTTSAASSVEETTATLNGNITSLGDCGNCTTRGFEYDTDSGSPYANDTNEAGSFGTGAYALGITSLTKGELYYFRAYATNPCGTGYGSELTFLTKPDAPNTFVATAASATQIDLTWVKGTGAQKTYIRGKQGSYPTDRADGTLIYNDTGSSASHSSLSCEQNWYYRAWSYATEGALEQYSDLYDQDNATTSNCPATVTTKACTGFGHTWAILNGEIDNESGSVTQIGWDYGLTDAYGSSYTESGSYTTGVNYSAYIDGLTPGTLYHFRFKGYNGSWAYGDDMVMATEGSPSLYEYLDTNNDTSADDIYGANWGYQTFTVDEAHTVESLYLLIKRTGSPGDVVASIKHTSGGTPTGEDLGSVTYDGDTFSTSESWYIFDFSDQGVVLEAAQYAIVVKAVDGDDSNDVQWACDASGGLSEGEPGNAGHSTNSGVTWSSDAPQDNLFKIWGYPALDIADAKVFTGYREDDDWLIVARYTNLYPPYYDSYDVKRYFVLQLTSDNITYAETALPQWGHRVASIYINADDVESLEYEGGYRVRMYGLFTGNPYTEYELQPADWYGDDLTNLDSWIITSAGEIGDYYDTEFTTYIADRGEVLNAEGGVLMANGIAGLGAVRPGIFQTYTLDNLIDEDDTITQEGRQNFKLWQARVGEDGTLAFGRIANVIGVEDGGAVLAGIFLIISLLICGFGFTPGHTVAANVLSLIPLVGGIVFGVDAIWIVAMAIVAAFLFVKAAFMDK